ncbi:MAG: hypothetical protein PHR28_03755 [candidate division Zixibacteria bacterium]|nr:hypothetical protein [candidate division Zixibacteria bacterium]
MKTLLPSGEVAYSTIGMAFDYRLRYYFRATPINSLVAWQGAEKVVKSMHYSQDWVAGLFKDLSTIIDHIKPTNRRLGQKHEERLARLCYILACFEQEYRAGPFFDSPLALIPRDATTENVLQSVPDAAAKDLVRLSHLAYRRWKQRLGGPTFMNPTFAGSDVIGGADADLIADHCLWEVKTTVDPRICRFWLYQLIGYVLLDFLDRYKLHEVGIYFSRQGEFLRWPIKELMAHLSIPGTKRINLRALRRDFEDVCIESSPLFTGGLAAAGPYLRPFSPSRR